MDAQVASAQYGDIEVFHPTEAKSKLCPYLDKPCVSNRCMKWRWCSTTSAAHGDVKRSEYGYCGA